MPVFAFPWVLLLLPVVPLLVWRWWLRKKPALVYSSGRLLDALPVGRVPRVRRFGLGLRLAGLVLLVFALAGPRWPDPGSRLPTEGIALAMVVDVSRSMDNRDFLWDTEAITRLEGAKKLFRLFVAGGQGPGKDVLAGRRQDLVSLVLFATRPELACPLTLEHDGLLQILDKVQPRRLLTEAASNPGDALGLALVGLRSLPPGQQVKRKVIILLSDGESNVPPPALTPHQAGQLAANLNIPIYAIDTNPEEPAPEDADARKARENLKDLARLTSGEYFHAADAHSLQEVYARIDKLERGKIVSFRYARYHDAFIWFALAALICWLGMVCLENTRWRTLP